ncbi:MAG: hypothetical protein L3K09_04525 [Thermoplasmata archaeon]|nr:hypothetical protein [Thermoplasmata archaeon]
MASETNYRRFGLPMLASITRAVHSHSAALFAFAAVSLSAGAYLFSQPRTPLGPYPEVVLFLLAGMAIAGLLFPKHIPGHLVAWDRGFPRLRSDNRLKPAPSPPARVAVEVARVPRPTGTGSVRPVPASPAASVFLLDFGPGDRVWSSLATARAAEIEEEDLEEPWGAPVPSPATDSPRPATVLAAPPGPFRAEELRELSPVIDPGEADLWETPMSFGFPVAPGDRLQLEAIAMLPPELRAAPVPGSPRPAPTARRTAPTSGSLQCANCFRPLLRPEPWQACTNCRGQMCPDCVVHGLVSERRSWCAQCSARDELEPSTAAG